MNNGGGYPPFYVALEINQLILHNLMLDYGAKVNAMPYKVDPGHAQVHVGDNSRLNESSTVMAEAYKKNQQSRKHTRSTRIIHTQRQYARI